MLAALFFVSIVTNFILLSNKPEPKVVVKHDTLWHDSIIREPQPADTIQTGRTVYVRVPVKEYLPGDTLRDTISVALPVEQRRYDDSLYTAWVSGYEPALDSLRLHLPEVQTTVTRTIMKPPPLITFGIQAGAGYGITARRPDLYIGAGVQINLWRK